MEESQCRDGINSHRIHFPANSLSSKPMIQLTVMAQIPVPMSACASPEESGTAEATAPVVTRF
jgi:hypothetical protein